MYSFMITESQLEARIKPESDYAFFTYQGPAMTVEFRGHPIPISKGDRFGVRPSSNGKFIRLVFPNDPTRVITIDQAEAAKLAKGAKP
jgi:hypothetical protein